MSTFLKTILRNALLAAAAWLVGFSAVYAYAQDLSVDNPLYTTIRGAARFEKHRTVTPRYCTQDGCVQPRPYWAVVIDAPSGVHYELNQIFDLGQTQSPAAIQLDQVTIRPGMHLMIHGRVDAASRGFAVVSDVESVQVDQRGLEEMSELRAPDGSDGAPFFGWTCRSVGEALPVYVDVEQISRGGTYAMRVQSEMTKDGSDLRTVAAFDSVSLNLTQANIGFVGTTSRLQAELDIDQRSGRFNALDSTLRMRGEAFSSDTEFSSQRSVKLICDRTR